MIEDVTTLSLGDRHRTRFNVTKIPATGALGVTLVTPHNKKLAVTMLLTARQHEQLLRFLTPTRPTEATP